MHTDVNMNTNIPGSGISSRKKNNLELNNSSLRIVLYTTWHFFNFILQLSLKASSSISWAHFSERLNEIHIPGDFLYQTAIFSLNWAWTQFLSHSLFTLLIPSQVQKGKPNSLHFIYMDERQGGIWYCTARYSDYFLVFFKIHFDSSLCKGIQWVKFIWRRGKPGWLWVSFEISVCTSKTRQRCFYCISEIT